MTHEIRLYGPIGGFFGFTADEILSQIPDNATEVLLRIHSPGGSVGEGLAIYHALRDHKANIITVVDGYAASSASFVMLAGDERRVHRNSIVFVHNPWTFAEGNADELRKTAEGLDVHTDAIADIYVQRTGMGESELRDMMSETAFFRGQEAVEKGFADTVIDNPEAEAQIAAMLEFEGLAARTKGAMTMSKTEQRKDIIIERDELKAQLVTRDELLTETRDSLAAANKAHEAAMSAAEAKQAELQDQVAMLTAEAAKAETLKAELDTAKAEITKQENMLKHPAFADAQKTEAKDPPTPDPDAEARAAEAEALKQTKEKDDAEKPTYLKWKAIKDPGEKRAYWLENKAAIEATQDEEPAKPE